MSRHFNLKCKDPMNQNKTKAKAPLNTWGYSSVGELTVQAQMPDFESSANT